MSAKRTEKEKQLSEANRPPYYKWAFKNKKVELFLTLVGIAGCIFATPAILQPEVPFMVKVGALIAIYGFTIGMALQPYTIYRDLKKMNYWSPNSPYQK